MHIPHDKHQYYFEKYLRNEMQGEELQLFEKKLANSSDFLKAFEFYKNHRSEIVAEELAEYDVPELMIKKPQKWGWVYAVLSMVCLVLILDYYLSDSYHKEQRRLRIPLIDQIHVFDSKQKTVADTVSNADHLKNNKTESKSNEANSETENGNLPEQYLSQLIDGNEVKIQGDYFVTDSLFRVLESKLVSERLAKLKVQTDSLLSDTTLEELVRQSFFKQPSQIPRQLLVEYWDSPLHFRGYVFDGKKLLVYDIKSGEQFYLSYSEEINSYYLIVQNSAYFLFPDNHFHKLAEE